MEALVGLPISCQTSFQKDCANTHCKYQRGLRTSLHHHFSFPRAVYEQMLGGEIVNVLIGWFPLSLLYAKRIECPLLI